MGAYLIYKLVNPKEALKANTFLDKQEEQKKLQQIHRGLWFWDKRDREIELEKFKKTGCGCPVFMEIGEGEWKASGIPMAEEFSYNLIVKLFAKLHKVFKVNVYSGSCALTSDYFNKKQLKIITKNGSALTGKNKQIILALIEEDKK